jgi:hypothetical protein
MTGHFFFQLFVDINEEKDGNSLLHLLDFGQNNEHVLSVFDHLHGRIEAALPRLDVGEVDLEVHIVDTHSAPLLDRFARLQDAFIGDGARFRVHSHHITECLDAFDLQRQEKRRKRDFV